MQVGAIDKPHLTWTALIDDVVAGRWIDPDTGRPAHVPFGCVIINDNLSGLEAHLVRSVLPAGSYAVVSDENTHDLWGAAIAKALGPSARSIVLQRPHADVGEVAALREKNPRRPGPDRRRLGDDQ